MDINGYCSEDRLCWVLHCECALKIFVSLVGTIWLRLPHNLGWILSSYWNMGKDQDNTARMRVTANIAKGQVWDSCISVSATYAPNELWIIIHILPGHNNTKQNSVLPIMLSAEAQWSCIQPIGWREFSTGNHAVSTAKFIKLPARSPTSSKNHDASNAVKISSPERYCAPKTFRDVFLVRNSRNS